MIFISDLNQSITNAKKIFVEIKKKHPTIKAHLVLSTNHNIAPIDTPVQTLFDTCEDFFIENDDLINIWSVLDELWDLNEGLAELRRKKFDGDVQQIILQASKLQKEYDDLLPKILISPKVCVDLRWDDIDYEINRMLRADYSLVDTNRTPQIGGIRICLGSVLDLLNRHF